MNVFEPSFFLKKTVFTEHRITPLFAALARRKIATVLLYLSFDYVEYVKFEIKRDACGMLYRYMLRVTTLEFQYNTWDGKFIWKFVVYSITLGGTTDQGYIPCVLGKRTIYVDVLTIDRMRFR